MVGLVGRLRRPIGADQRAVDLADERQGVAEPDGRPDVRRDGDRERAAREVGGGTVEDALEERDGLSMGTQQALVEPEGVGRENPDFRVLDAGGDLERLVGARDGRP